MSEAERIVRLGAAGAALASLLLLAIAFVVLPAGLSYPGLPVLTGQITLAPADLDAYLAGMRTIFTLDGIFLVGWLLAWLGLFIVVRGRSPLLGWLTMGFGLAGALCDFGENSLILGALAVLEAGQLPSLGWMAGWKAVQHLSYWLPFLGAVFAGLALWSRRGLDRSTALLGTLGVAIAAAGLYFPALALASNVWFLLWFVNAALLLAFAQMASAASPQMPSVDETGGASMSARSRNPERKVAMSASRARTLRLALYATIYFLQGAVLTYFTAFNVLYLRSFDLSFSLIGIAGGITLTPFILKIFIGLLSDRVNPLRLGHRKPYIITGLILQTLAFLLVPLVNPGSQFGFYLVLMLLAALGMSTYDTTTDGLAIDTTPPQDRGLVQGLMVGGRALSMVLTAVVMGVFAGRGQWNANFLLVAGLGVLTLIIALLVQEARERAPEMRFSRAAFGSFKDKAFLLFLVVGLIYPLALYSAQGMIGAFLNEGLNVSLAAVGLYTSVFGIGAVLGGIIGGPLMRRIGERNSLLAALLLTSAVTFILAITPSAGLMWAVVFLFGFAFGYYETAYLAIGMDFADPRIAAFMFSVIMAVGNIGIAGGQPLAGILVDSVGFRAMFAVFAFVHLLALPLVFVIFRIRRQSTASVPCASPM